MLIFTVVRIVFFSLYKMIESENSPDNFKILKISIGAIMKNPEMLKLVPDHYNTKKILRLKKLLFLNNLLS